MIVARFISSLRTLWSQHFPLCTRLYQHVTCKKPLLFSSSSRYRNLVLCKVRVDTKAYPNTVGNSREELEVSRYPRSGFHRGSEGLRSWTKFSLNSCGQSGKSCNRSLCTSSRPSFLFFCSSTVGLRSGFPSGSSLVLPLLYGTGFSVYLLMSNTESCDVAQICVGVVEELVDKPGTTNATKFDILQSILLPFLMRCVFRPLIQW